MLYLYIAIGGAVGSVARAAIGSWAIEMTGRDGFPWWTLLVNVLGSFLLGIVLTALPHDGGDDAARALLALGFCGAFTTFSTFGYEVLALWRGGSWGAAGAYVVASVVVGLAAVAMGIRLAGGIGS